MSFRVPTPSLTARRGDFPHPADRLARFQLARHRFTVTASSHFRLGMFPGSTWHGGFQGVLRRPSSLFHAYFFEPRLPPNTPRGLARLSPPKPFVLTPLSGGETHYQPGDELGFELVLFGYSVHHFSVCLDAFAELGKRGFGSDKGYFTLSTVDLIQPRGEPLPVFRSSGGLPQWGGPFHCDALSVAGVPDATRMEGVRLEFATRVRLKSGNRLLRRAPSFPELFGRLLDRLNMLAWVHQGFEITDAEIQEKLLRHARTVELVEDRLRWSEWSRFSTRQQEWMKFGGLLGEVAYGGDLTPFLPYLRLAEWLHLGGKSSFGLGRVHLKPE